MKSCVWAAALFALLALPACAETIDGSCNACPSFSTVNTDGCQEAAEAAGCATFEVRTVTDDDCAVGEPPMEHLECVYTGCAEEVDCSRFATR